MLSRFHLGLAITSLASACAITTPTPLARVRRGPAYDQPPALLLGLPATCNTATAGGCEPAYQRAVDMATRMAIEYAGYSLIDSERVNLELRQRREHIASSESLGASAEAHEVEVTGSTWADATPAERQALVRELSIDGLLLTTISFGEARGWSAQQTVRVGIAVMLAATDQLVWRSQCSVETGDHHSTTQAIDLATRCALEAATLP